jgi:hypothetical protein
MKNPLTTKIGTKVVITANNPLYFAQVHLIGTGTLVGYEVPTEEAVGTYAPILRKQKQVNPKLVVDEDYEYEPNAGKVVWGCEAWWSDEEEFAIQTEGKEVIQIDLDEARQTSRDILEPKYGFEEPNIDDIMKHAEAAAKKGKPAGPEKSFLKVKPTDKEIIEQLTAEIEKLTKERDQLRLQRHPSDEKVLGYEYVCEWCGNEGADIRLSFSDLEPGKWHDEIVCEACNKKRIKN